MLATAVLRPKALPLPHRRNIHGNAQPFLKSVRVCTLHRLQYFAFRDCDTTYIAKDIPTGRKPFVFPVRREHRNSECWKFYVSELAFKYDENTFNECKSKIKNISPKFIIGDIRNIKLERNYDNIWLSNSGQYLKLEELKNVVDNLSNNLNNEGKMLVCYLYRTIKTSKYKEDWAEIYNLPKLFELFKKYNLDIISFIGPRGILHESPNMKDSVLIYKK